MSIVKLLGVLTFVGASLSALSAEADAPVRLPSMPEDQLLHRVDPVYPAAALRNHIRGVVRFAVTIGKDGRIEGLRLISGHPLLRQAARQAARQWVYRPVLRGGRPVRVISTLEVRFRLDEHGRPMQDRSPTPSPRV
jgi:protein TonB